MKRIILFVLILFSLSCDDGDLDIANFEFEETINVCGDFTLYRLSTNEHKEVLMLTLTDKQIKKDTIPVLPVQVTKIGPYTVTDRVFDSEVTSSYFCTVVPPVEPKVLKNWEGESGTVFVKNSPLFDTDEITIIGWEHIIVLQDVVLKSGDESLIFNDTYLFGTLETGI
ncbi:MAG: hypothetical protein KAH67_00925 [Flavobacteriaceae bacterium]|nr:hypothetical protein [Flavobacteriaceae bacterium]